jgi:DNA-binding transcriptional MerR regulator
LRFGQRRNIGASKIEGSVSTGLRLGDYAVTPLYNIKAVVQATGISPSTLRAWERRYNIARPQRSDSGYRLYAERDVAVIRWLKAQVDAGMSISQAVSWLGNLVTDADGMEQAILPTAGSGAPLHDPLGTLPGTHREPVRDFDTLQQELMQALINYDEDEAETIIAEAFSLYSVEQVGDNLFMPTLLQMGERRQQGDLSIIAEHFSSNYLIQRLGTLLRLIPNGTGGPLIWVASPLAETLDVGALLLTIYLRRAGYRVHYLGQRLPVEERAVQNLISEAKRHQPAMILLSASTMPAGGKLGQLSARLTHSGHMPAIIAYSGLIYSRNPEVRATTAGVYIGTYAKEIVQNIDELLVDKHRADKKHDKKTAIDKTMVDRVGATNR